VGKQTKLKRQGNNFFSNESKHVFCAINDRVKKPDKGRRPEEVLRGIQY